MLCRHRLLRGSWFFLTRSLEPSDPQKAVQFSVTDGACEAEREGKSSCASQTPTQRKDMACSILMNMMWSAMEAPPSGNRRRKQRRSERLGCPGKGQVGEVVKAMVKAEKVQQEPEALLKSLRLFVCPNKFSVESDPCF